MSLGTGAAIASAVVALFAAGIAIAAAEFSRRQANAARRQAEAVEEQASAAWEQVAEARKANEAAAEDRARMAVRWSAQVEPGWLEITVRNVGTDTAMNVIAQSHGADEDWVPVWVGDEKPECAIDRVRAGESFSFDLEEYTHPPREIYLYWRGAPHPTTVVVDGAPY